mmetsp:Transcript_3248/g.3541  ORF Transcript_3248/g.3541 Transcript_3248/m.3541 type:complete len:184 (+) Transcript_3248:2-553(+)
MSRVVAHLEDYLSDVNVSAKLVATSIQNKLLPIAHQMKEETLRNDTKLSSDTGSISETLSEVNLSSVKERSLSLLEKEEISSGFSAVAGLLDDLWNSLKPEYSMNIVTPIDIPEDQSPPIPTVLSTMMTSEELQQRFVADAAFQEQIDLTSEEERSLQELVKIHRDHIDEIVEDFTLSFQYDS